MRRPLLIVGIDNDPIKLQNYEHNLGRRAITKGCLGDVPTHLTGILELIPVWLGRQLNGFHLQLSPPCQPFCYRKPGAAAEVVQLSLWLQIIAEVAACGGSACLEESANAIEPTLKVITALTLRLYVYCCCAELPPVCLPSTRTRMYVTTYELPICAAFERVL